jgi:acyl-CoA synthetase (AMP-forming)/AMP-acid ligase II/NADP-dependent 3-hydroxy acid dehydrogenase YdfG/acyl carrier protein
MAMSPMDLDRDRLTAALSADPNVRECTVLPGTAGDDGLTVHIAPNGRRPSAAFRERVRKILPEGLPGRSVEVVLVSALPLTNDGAIDEQALAGLRPLRPQADRIEKELERIEGVAEVAALVRPSKPEAARVHLADIAAASSQSEPQRLLQDSPGNQPLAVSSAPSLVVGGAILDRRCEATLLDFLEQASHSERCGEIVFLDQAGDESRLSYRDLAEEARRVLGGLRAHGVGRGDKVLLQLADNRSFVAALWGCIAGGVSAVPIAVATNYTSTNAAVKKLRSAWELLDAPLIVTDEALAPQLEQALRQFDGAERRLVTIERLAAHAPLACESAAPDDVCLMLLTSGSTGTPKIVPLTHRNVVCRSLGQAQRNGFDSSARLFNWFPMDHVGAVVMYHFLALTLNATQVLAPTEYILKEPVRWLDIIDRYRITDTWAPNFAFALINDSADEVARRKPNLSSLRTLLNGGEAIVPQTARRFIELLTPYGLADRAMLPAWGMSETSSGVTCGRFLDRPPADGASFTCVGGPIPGVSLRIVGADDALVPMGVIGRVQIRGLPVFGGYYRNDQANEAAFTPDGWFETGDLGMLDEGGLTITGRAKDVIIVNGLNFYCHEIEAAAEQAPGVDVSFTAASAVRSPEAESDQLAIFFHPTHDDGPERMAAVRAVRTLVMEQAGVTPDFVLPVEREDIPKTAIGKIERNTLRRRFEAGEFAELQREVERALGGANTMPACFFERTWLRKKAVYVSAALAKQRYLILADSAGLGDRLREALERTGCETLIVYPGDSLRQIGPGAFEIDPGAQAYAEILELASPDAPIDHVVHCWAYTADADEAEDVESLRRQLFQSVYSLLGVVQGLAARQGEGRSVKLTVVSNRAQAVADSDTVEPWKGAALGLIRTLALELPWLECRSVDLGEGAIGETLLDELRVTRGPAEVAFRGGERWIPTLRDVDMTTPPPGPGPIRSGGVYLVTGGLGSLGCEVAKWLAGEADAKLLLIGRSELSPRGRARLETIQALGDALYVQADVADREALHNALELAREHWGRDIDGIFHLAGEGNLTEHWSRLGERRATAASVAFFQSMLRAKVYGTQNLLRLLDSNPEALFVSFSSVNSLFGGATFSAYATANAYLDACAAARRANPNYFNFNWSMWDGLGMAEGNPEYARAATEQMGFLVLSREQAMAALRGAMVRRRRNLVIGVDRANPHLAPHFEGSFRELEEITPFVRLEAEAGEEAMKAIRELCHLAGWASPQWVDERAIDADGRIDRDALAAAGGAGQGRPPESETERSIARLWAALLNTTRVDAAANFFELGGDSLTAARLLNRLEKELGWVVSIRALFENPTVEGLAAAIDRQRLQENDQPRSALPDVDELSLEEADALLAALSVYDEAKQ